ncbi:hypothetical protein CAC42_7837 [Sphaceloma murrayae]|uniref:GATA-type domain-containing protein n=1 Tax=Sphaceloma murrayae TaxID=2082308 RepID=A0A2K1QY05_9PEZI|nr:hypothetical protein CAC42_7837 [Sphaceloma murrayae]
MSGPRRNIPQAFVSSYAPRIRTYANSLLIPVQPQTVIPPLRTTKRGTTAINYSEDFADESIEDSDAPRRPLRGKRQEDLAADAAGPQKELGRELYAPVDVQSIWREWMGKPKRSMTEKQVQVQAVLPTNLVPIRIDLNIAPFQPDPPLPKPSDLRERGLDENHPAYRVPEITPEYRLKDYFLWNLHEALMTPDQFAKVLVDDLDFPTGPTGIVPDRKQQLINSIAQQIRSQLEEHAGVELHPFFSKEKLQPAQTIAPAPAPSAVKPALSRNQSGTPLPSTPSVAQKSGLHGVTVPVGAPPANGIESSTPATPLADGKDLTIVAEHINPVLNPEDVHRCVITISLNMQNRLLSDKFEWSLLHPPGLPEMFAKQTCADLGLSGEWIPALAHSIYEAVLKLKKDVVENGGSLPGVVGSGVTQWGEIENEAAEVHGDGSLAIGEGAGWRYDQDVLGAEWEPRVEVLSKDEIEKREGDRERQLRRMRRDMAARAAPQPSQRESFYGGLGEMGGDEERMGRGERAKKKRRFRSLSPVGRDSPDLAAAFGGEAGKLSETERQTWRCSHCQVWGTAVWSVRDGPNGSRTLCNNCGYLYEHNHTLPPWSRDMYASERDAGSNRYDPSKVTTAHQRALQQPVPQPQRSNITPQPDQLSRSNHFVPNPARAHSQTFFRHSNSFTGAAPTNLTEQYAATLRGGGPQMFQDYAIEGEDLDWTKVTDARERKRLQNIINGRKYRERRLAQEGQSAEGSPAPSGAGGSGVTYTGYSGSYQGQGQLNFGDGSQGQTAGLSHGQGQSQMNMGGQAQGYR